MNEISLYWYNNKINFGDILSPIIIEYLSGLKCKYSVDKNKLISLGSILDKSHPILPNDIIWGSGCRGIYYIHNDIDVRLVRGPLTRNTLLKYNIACPEKYCDPGVLTPFIFNINLNENITNEMLFLLHFNDRKYYNLNILIKNFENKNIPYIFMDTDNIQYILSKIAASKYVISSALHGIIVSECMGKPTAYLRLRNKEPVFKYTDYYLGSNRLNSDIKVTDWTKHIDFNNITYIKKPKIDFKNLIESFPYQLKDENIINKIIAYYDQINII